jgi:hypothetical protein
MSQRLVAEYVPVPHIVQNGVGFPDRRTGEPPAILPPLLVAGCRVSDRRRAYTTIDRRHVEPDADRLISPYCHLDPLGFEFY